jgi:hypothetical protein
LAYRCIKLKIVRTTVTLDVNVLLAIDWPNHQFHATAIAALSGQNRWATCALTQLGFIRLSSNPTAIVTAKSLHEATGLLARLVADSFHIYLDSLPAPTSKDWRSRAGAANGGSRITQRTRLAPTGTRDATAPERVAGCITK